MQNRTFTTNKLTQTALRAMLIQADWNIFGTLKFQPVRMIDAYRTHELLRQYWNKLDRILCGTSVRKGCRIQRWCFAHEGSHNDNYHIHFVARSPVDADQFCCLSNTLWVKLDRATAGIKKNWITPVVHRNRVANYMVKEVWKLGAVSFDACLSCAHPQAFEATSERHELRAARIRSAMSDNEERASRAALEMHKAETQRRLALRR